MTTVQKTRCPHCKSAFRVTKAQLDAAGGIVRCGICFKTFDAFENLESDGETTTLENSGDYLIDDNFDLSLLEEDSSKISATAKVARPDISSNHNQNSASGKNKPETINAQAEPADTQTASAQDFSPAAPPDDKPASTTIDSKTEADTEVSGGYRKREQAGVHKSIASLPSLGEDEDKLAIDAKTMSHWRQESSSLIENDDQPKAGTKENSPTKGQFWLWFTGSMLAILMLLAQLIYFNSLSVTRGSSLWPLTSWFCSLTGCPLQPMADSSKILTGELMVRTHPRVSSALFVDAVILNQGNFEQPFPHLRLIFENLQGAVIAQRIFTPADYLQGEVSNFTLMPTQRPIKLELEIIDPGKEAVSFRLIVEP